MKDRRAELEGLYRERFPVFLRVATAITRDEQRAYDAVQEGFATAIREERRFRGEGTLEAWVWRIVVNAALKTLRDEPATAVPPSANGAAPTVDPDLRARIAQLRAHRVRQRQGFVFRVSYGQ